jgi:hypothetical protein
VGQKNRGSVCETNEQRLSQCARQKHSYGVRQKNRGSVCETKEQRLYETIEQRLSVRQKNRGCVRQ